MISLSRLAAAASLTVVLTSCDENLNEAQKAKLLADVEARVVMPKGAVDLTCYWRKYLLKDGVGPDNGKTVMIGHYGRSRIKKPGAIWVESDKQMAHVVDQGCQSLSIYAVVGELKPKIQATCFPAFDGSSPQGADAERQFAFINREAGVCPAPSTGSEIHS